MKLLVLLIPFAWVLMAAGLLIAFRGRTLIALWREPFLAHPVVIVESDDWGTGPDSDGEMLRRLADRLATIRDAEGHPAVMTIGIVSGQPDGAAILASGLDRYHRRSLSDPEFVPIVLAIRAGCDAGVFALQRHGLEHCWPPVLLRRAREDDAVRLWLADPTARSEALPSPMQSRWIDTSTLPSHPLPKAEIEAAVAEEALLLQHVFGEVPPVAVPNTFVWNDDVERAWAATGVTCIVTPGCRVEGRDAAGGLQPAIRRIRNGDRTANGVLQVVRDDYFEPIRGHRAEQVWRAVEAKACLGRPVLLETHRESFIAAPERSESFLAELERALRGVCERWPDVRFMSTAELAQHLADPGSPLQVRPTCARIACWLQRIRCEATLRRLLKYGCLSILLVLLLRIGRQATIGHCSVTAS